MQSDILFLNLEWISFNLYKKLTKKESFEIILIFILKLSVVECFLFYLDFVV